MEDQLFIEMFDCDNEVSIASSCQCGRRHARRFTVEDFRKVVKALMADREWKEKARPKIEPG